MEIRVKIIPNSKVPSVVRIDDADYRIKVNAPAMEGRANKRLMEILAEHFHVSKSRVRILKGVGSREKLVNVDVRP